MIVKQSEGYKPKKYRTNASSEDSLEAEFKKRDGINPRRIYSLPYGWGSNDISRGFKIYIWFGFVRMHDRADRVNISQN